MNARNAKGIEGGGAVVEKQNVGACVLAVPRIDAFVFAVVNPPAIKDDGHARKPGRFAELVASGASCSIHGNPGERPIVRASGGSVDSIPAINMKSMPCFLTGRRPRLGAFRIIAAGRVEAINFRQPRGTMKDIIASLDGIIGRSGLRWEVFRFVEDGWPACA